MNPNSSERVFTLPAAPGLSSTYFVKLALHDTAGKSVSENFYWLSTQPDTLGEPQAGSDWYYTPTKQYADFTALNTLPVVDLKVSAVSKRKGAEDTTTVTIENPGAALAFFVHLKVNREKDGEEILPVLWQDNYFSLLPGERRQLSATYGLDDLAGSRPEVQVDGWNIKPQTVPALR
jgi:exo-1,4-beta-D-glucosaminidase